METQTKQIDLGALNETRINKLEQDIANLNRAEEALSKIDEENIPIKKSKQSLLKDIEKKKSLCQEELTQRNVIASYKGKQVDDLSSADKKNLKKSNDYIKKTLPVRRNNIFGRKSIQDPCIDCIDKEIEKVRLKQLNVDMSPSEDGLRFLKSFEAIGFICPDGKVRAYQDDGCGRGNWTVGVGEKTDRDKDSEFSSEGEAMQSFEDKTRSTYSDRVKDSLVRNNVNRKLTQQEFDALVDLAYNHGNCDAIAKKIAAGVTISEDDFTSIPGTKGDILQRRKDEFKLFSNQPVTVGEIKKYKRKDNTNGGYCPLKDESGKPVRGYTVEKADATYELNKAPTVQ